LADHRRLCLGLLLPKPLHEQGRGLGHRVVRSSMKLTRR
jgi:hypothetical protein